MRIAKQTPANTNVRPAPAANTNVPKAANDSTAVTNPFIDYGRGAAGRNFVGDLLLFSKFGEFTFGLDRNDMPLGTQLAAHMDAFCIGWQRWEDNKPVETIMGPVAQGFIPPKRDTLGYLDKTWWETFDDGRPKDPWTFTNTLVLSSVEDEPRFYTFSTTSKGGIRALAKLSLRHGERHRMKAGEIPIITINRGSYPHPDKSIGEVRVPVFTVVKWVPDDTLPPIEGGV
jgi:hypothetical protein